VVARSDFRLCPVLCLPYDGASVPVSYKCFCYQSSRSFTAVVFDARANTAFLARNLDISLGPHLQLSVLISRSLSFQTAFRSQQRHPIPLPPPDSPQSTLFTRYLVRFFLPRLLCERSRSPPFPRRRLSGVDSFSPLHDAMPNWQCHSSVSPNIFPLA